MKYQSVVKTKGRPFCQVDQTKKARQGSRYKEQGDQTSKRVAPVL